jgi:hypothetical protein
MSETTVLQGPLAGSVGWKVQSVVGAGELTVPPSIPKLISDTLRTFPPLAIAWNVSVPTELAGVTVTPPVDAGWLTVTVNAVDWTPTMPEVGPESVADVGTAAAL